MATICQMCNKREGDPVWKGKKELVVSGLCSEKCRKDYWEMRKACGQRAKEERRTNYNMKTKIEIVPMRANNMFKIKDRKKNYELLITTTSGKVNKMQSIFPLVPSVDGLLLKRIDAGIDFTQNKMRESLERKRVIRNKSIRGKIINFFTQEVKI